MLAQVCKTRVNTIVTLLQTIMYTLGRQVGLFIMKLLWERLFYSYACRPFSAVQRKAHVGIRGGQPINPPPMRNYSNRLWGIDGRKAAKEFLRTSQLRFQASKSPSEENNAAGASLLNSVC